MCEVSIKRYYELFICDKKCHVYKINETMMIYYKWLQMVYILHVWVIPHILEMRDVFYVMHAKVWWGFNFYHIFVNEL